MNVKIILRSAVAATILIAIPAISGEKTSVKTVEKPKSIIRLPLACQPAPECLIYPN